MIRQAVDGWALTSEDRAALDELEARARVRAAARAHAVRAWSVHPWVLAGLDDDDVALLAAIAERAGGRRPALVPVRLRPLQLAVARRLALETLTAYILALELDEDRAAVTKALRALVRRGLVERVGRSTYALSPRGLLALDGGQAVSHAGQRPIVRGSR